VPENTYMNARLRSAAIAAVTPFVMAGAAKRTAAQAPTPPLTPEVATAPALALPEQCGSQWLLGFDYTHPQGMGLLLGNRYESEDCRKKFEWVMGFGRGTGRVDLGVPLQPRGSQVEVIPGVTLVGIQENHEANGDRSSYRSEETYVGPKVQVGGRDFPFRAGVAVLFPVTGREERSPRLSVGLKAIF
jgi:hypothetical protein